MKQRGFTILEVMFALAILSIGILGTAAALNACLTARVYNQELVTAVNAARQKYEEMYEVGQTSAGYNNLFNRYRYGTTENTFDITINEKGVVKTPLKTPQDGGNRNNKIAWIDFPVASLIDITLDERINGNDANTTIAQIARDLGMPRDINIDGDITDSGLDGTTYNLLPVCITIRWESAMGIREYKFSSAIFRPSDQL